MLGTFVNIFKIPDLRKKILFTAAMLVIYRIGFAIPAPGVNFHKYQEMMKTNQDSSSPLGQIADYLQMFTGGRLDQSSLFGLGIMPYISASIILMLLGEVVPSLRKLRQEGQTGYKKIQEYTRYLTVLLCIFQAWMYLKYVVSTGASYGGLEWSGVMLGMLGMTAGTIFLMWLGEQIDEYGIGNGISLIIMAGILARMPWAIGRFCNNMSWSVGAGPDKYGPMQMIFLLASFVFVVAGAILITQAQRRIPIQQAKQMRGHRMYGGQRHYLPLRVNHGGVMPIIFASSLMMFPPVIFAQLVKVWPNSQFMAETLDSFRRGAFIYNLFYVALIFLFAYFWTTVQFQPKEMAKRLRDTGAFVPGLRPGHRTEEYLETVMARITYFGAAFLSFIAVVPSVVSLSMGIDPTITQFLGGTGLLIVVSVSLDLVQRIEANLLMRNYEGFSQTGRIKGAYA
jgi:preprotein translocase subunit SecY